MFYSKSLIFKHFCDYFGSLFIDLSEKQLGNPLFQSGYYVLLGFGMYQNKAIQILKTFSAHEIRQFADFVVSPFFNKNETIIRLFDILFDCYPEFDAPIIERTALFKAVYGDDIPIEEQKLRYALSDLTKLLEEYICVKAVDEEELFKYHLLLYSYRQRLLDKPFMATLKHAEKVLEDWPRRDVSHAFYQYLIEEDKYKFSSVQKEHTLESNLQQVVDNLDKYFILNKMRYSAEIINNRNVVAINYRLFLYEEIMNHLRNNPLDHVPAAKVYYNVILTLTDPENKRHYENLLSLLNEHKDIFSHDELFDMYVYAKNFCIRKINNGHTEFMNELFSLYKVILNNKIIFRENYLSQWDYKNIIYLGLRLEEFDWVKSFIHEYNDSLDPRYRKNAYTYNMAYYHFFLSEYDKTLTLLQSVDFSDVYYHLDSKSLLLKTYYELDATEAFFSLVDAFKVYIKRNKQIPAHQKTNYNNLIKFVTRLYKWKLNPKKKLSDIAEEMDRTKPLADVIWLRKKIEDALEEEEKLSGKWRS